MTPRRDLLFFQEPYAVVLANGDFPKSEKTLAYLSKASYLTCCDGAANQAIANGFMPDVIVGDLDSLDPEIKTSFSNIVVHISEQESNDLSKAFNYCLSKGWENVVILGASGKREDHLLGNVSLLAEFATRTKSIQMPTEFGCFCVVSNPGIFYLQKGRQLSLFSLNPQQEISSEGLKYPLNRLRLSSWYVGTLNETLADQFTLDFTPVSPIILYIAD